MIQRAWVTQSEAASLLHFLLFLLYQPLLPGHKSGCHAPVRDFRRARAAAAPHSPSDRCRQHAAEVLERLDPAGFKAPWHEPADRLIEEATCGNRSRRGIQQCPKAITRADHCCRRLVGLTLGMIHSTSHPQCDIVLPTTVPGRSLDNANYKTAMPRCDLG